MRIITNLGTNVPDTALEHYNIALAPSKIVVDGVQHDMLGRVPLHEVDNWIAVAREHPYVLGTSAAEFAATFARLAKDDRELLVIMSSRKIIPSYDAALTAARTLASRPIYADLAIRVVDGTTTDIAVGLLAIMAGEAMRAGLSLDSICDLLDTMADQGRFVFIPRTLDNLVKGGRASFLRGWMANMLGLRPVLSFKDGEIKAGDTCRAKDDPARVIAQWHAKRASAKRVWVGISHGDEPDVARALLDQLRDHFEIEYATIQPISSTVYLHAGQGCLAAAVYSIEDLPWIPSVPPVP
jgi:DegV family protein with EDD domain